MGSQSVKAIESLSERKDFLYHLLNDVKALDMMIENDLLEKEKYRKITFYGFYHISGFIQFESVIIST